MSAWTHPMCEFCWLAENPDRQPTRLRETALKNCCWCGMETEAGIYVRHDPAELAHHWSHE